LAATAAASVCGAEEAKVDSRQTCVVLRGLNRADDDFAATISAHGNAVTACLISELLGRKPGSARADAASALVQAMATATPALDAKTSLRAREAVLNALRDRAVEVRVAAVTALADYGDETMVPALQMVAKSDPILSLREYTALAVSRMCKRLGTRARS
jgi:HEAT repeat protein